MRAWCPPEGPPKGALAPKTFKVLMKVLYAARVARPDLLRATCMMARRVTKWDADCDRRLHRFMCYINCTKHHVQTSYCGDRMDDLKFALFCDADFAGDKSDSKSTTGVVVCVAGPTTLFRIVTLMLNTRVLH
jgi:hypothetical protein